MTRFSGRSSGRSQCTTEGESKGPWTFIIPDLGGSYVDDLRDISQHRSLPVDAKRKLTLAANEIVLLRQVLDTTRTMYSEAVLHIEELEMSDRRREGRRLAKQERRSADAVR
jgi:hypothetical protein